jgi:hypothetical protein
MEEDKEKKEETKEEKKEEITEEIKAETDKPKRKNQKRKPEKEEEGSAEKRVKVVAEKETEPSFFRGGIVKPLLLAGLASASFYVNHLYNTSAPKKKIPTKEEIPVQSPPKAVVSERKNPTTVAGFKVG